MRSNLVTKLVSLLFAIVTLLLYVLADHVPTSRRDASTNQITPIERYPGSSLSKNLKQKHPVTAISHTKLKQAENNIIKICKHAGVELSSTKAMHDILMYMSVMSKPITYLDIGANIGGTSVPAVVCFKPKHRVIAIEPVKRNFEAIMNSKAGISAKLVDEERFVAANVGFSDETKKTKMFIPGRRGDNAALSEKASTIVFKDGLRQEEVMVHRGDNFLKMLKAEPKLIKIDVQGSEIRVLRGMEEYLKRHKGVLIMAEHDDRLIKNSGFGIYDVYDYMKQLGYKVYRKPEVIEKDKEFYIKSNEIDREEVTNFRGDLVYWKPLHNSS